MISACAHARPMSGEESWARMRSKAERKMVMVCDAEGALGSRLPVVVIEWGTDAGVERGWRLEEREHASVAAMVRALWANMSVISESCWSQSVWSWIML